MDLGILTTKQLALRGKSCQSPGWKRKLTRDLAVTRVTGLRLGLGSGP